MLKFWLYITSLLKYLLFGSIIGGLLTAFFSVVGMIIWGLLIIGSFGAAADDMKKRYAVKMEKRKQKLVKKKAEDLKFELEGFEQALVLTRRGMS